MFNVKQTQESLSVTVASYISCNLTVKEKALENGKAAMNICVRTGRCSLFLIFRLDREVVSIVK